jgi:hypothetical protein
MLGMDPHYPIAGLIVLIGAVALIKGLDFLAHQSVKRLLEMQRAIDAQPSPKGD